MMIRRLKTEDYDELLSVLSRAFHNPDFIRLRLSCLARSNRR